MFGFIITKDLISIEGEAPAGGWLQRETDLMKTTYPVEFTLHDDDGEHYFTGRGMDDGESLCVALDWAMGFAGCTILRIDGKDVIS